MRSFCTNWWTATNLKKRKAAAADPHTPRPSAGEPPSTSEEQPAWKEPPEAEINSSTLGTMTVTTMERSPTSIKCSPPRG